ncbi:conserved protein of unknown function [Paenibacillus alvei]|uniref:Uncharacterized protein n=1 Tax=Paenibacillus alvei TaxID=44250 RepID=A0A383RCS5_PAEAL|nr:conserved protein of unknown function [Paenibacillus alvei]
MQGAIQSPYAHCTTIQLGLRKKGRVNPIESDILSLPLFPTGGSAVNDDRAILFSL